VRQPLQDYAGAIADYTTAIRLIDSPCKRIGVVSCESFGKPFRSMYVAERAEARAKQKDYVGAIAEYTDLINRHPHISNYYYLRADLRLKLGDIAGAIADYDQAIQVNPADYESYQRRGLFRESQGDRTGAIADYQRILDRARQDSMAEFWVERATAQLQRLQQKRS
jgi:tetratricopeptide (TPR) repeat protein